MTVQSATDPAAMLASANAASAATKSNAQDSADRFLKLLVTQLKNQDPLNPMDNSAVTSQMAQINMVEGINKLNATLSTMSMAFNANESLQAATLVGRQVLAEGNSLNLAGGQAQGGYSLDAAADSLKLTVKSASGVAVYSSDLGRQDAGIHTFKWDGVASNGAQAAPGLYTFEISARVGGASAAAKTLMLGQVDGVTPAADGAKLTLRGFGEVAIASVKHIL